MASSSKRAWVSFNSAEIALEKIFYDEDTADGMDSGEESDLDRQIEVRSQYRPSRMVAIAHVVLKCEVVRLR